MYRSWAESGQSGLGAENGAPESTRNRAKLATERALAMAFSSGSLCGRCSSASADTRCVDQTEESRGVLDADTRTASG